MSLRFISRRYRSRDRLYLRHAGHHHPVVYSLNDAVAPLWTAGTGLIRNFRENLNPGTDPVSGIIPFSKPESKMRAGNGW